ncbi:MAG TPA: hypothetical protein VFQ91_06225 [Bryobacteraceae bacterium]|nr:hypothetical protein [Bryobacteraceae bacterium]
MDRRVFLASLSAAAARTAPAPGLSLNEDANHFFATRSGRRLTAEDVSSFVDQYAHTQIRELLFNVNAMRAGFASKTRTSFFDGYDPTGPDNQPMFASVPVAEAKAARAWVHLAWQLHQDGIDPYRLWLERARKHNIGAWVSIRMNDLHNVDDERHYLHSEFWTAHPEFRRVPYRMEQRDKALDYSYAAVREHNFQFIEEVVSRYRFDGLELDWMRFGFHFAPGREAAGAQLLTEFHRRVRKLVGPKVRIGVRVPSRPQTAIRLGLDALTWAREGLVDMVTATNFWRTVDNDMPISLWRELLPARITLAAGLELGLNAFPGSKAAGGRPFQTNSLDTVRGSAAAYLAQGANRIYLFNYMDSQTAMDDNDQYPQLLKEIGDPLAMNAYCRRHVVTYQDTWAPGEKPFYALPIDAQPGRWFSLRQPVGAGATNLRASVRLGVAGQDARAWEVRCNGAVAKFQKIETGLRPGPDTPVYRFAVDLDATEAVLDVRPTSSGRVEWAEIFLER